MTLRASLLPALVCLALPVMGQSLPEKFEKNRTVWEESLARGNAALVRKDTETILAQDGPSVNPSDYNAMHAMVAVMGLAANACVHEGAWEAAVAHLQKATQAATDNAATADGTFTKLRQQHQENLTTWRNDVEKLEQRSRDLDAQGGLTSDQIRTRTQIQAQLEENRNAITQSVASLAEIDRIMAMLKKEQDGYAASLSEWMGFLAKEKADLAHKGSAHAYVAEKLEQVRGDDAKPQVERLTYARRLLVLDPANVECRRLVDGLMGKGGDEEPPLPPKKKHGRE